MADTPASFTLDQHLCYAIYSAGLAIGRAYKPLLDALEITYPQFLVLNVLWEKVADGAGQSVGSIAERLMLESSTLTPLLKRLEVSGLLERTRNPADERQVLVKLTAKGRALQARSGCIAERMVSASGRSVNALQKLNGDIRDLRDAIVESLGER